MNADTAERLAGFCRVAEDAYQRGTALGWRLHHDDDGWRVEMLDPGKLLVVGKGKTIGEAIQALVEGLDWMAAEL